MQNTSILDTWLHLAILVGQKDSHFDHVISHLTQSKLSICKLGTILDLS